MKGDIWMKLMCLFGFHNWMVFHDSREVTARECMRCYVEEWKYRPKDSRTLPEPQQTGDRK